MTLLCALPFAASLFVACADASPFATGYVEGEFIHVAPVESAQVRAINVARGDRVAAGIVLVEMERKDAEIALAQAEANLAQAENQLANLLEGARPEEIAVIQANLHSAELQAEETRRQRDRILQLTEKGVSTDAQRDDAVTAAEVADAKVAEIRAQLSVAQLSARPQEIARARAAVDAARAARDQTQWKLENRLLALDEPVTVVDVIRRVGEIAGPSAPVLSVLGENAVKLRLYVPETSFADIAVGDLLAVGCDGCPAGVSARISYISDEPEFTPPVIYSLENRQKLVYLVEARPTDALQTGLKPGQIVDVRLQGTAK